MRTADADRIRAKRKRFEDVGSSANPAVDENRHASFHRLSHFRDALDSAAAGFGRPTAVVRHDDAVCTVFEGEGRILARSRGL